MTDEYRIETVKDFLKVPEDKRDECLRDFKTWLDTIEGLQSALAELADIDKNLVRIDTYIWLDDGKAGVSGIRVVTL